MSEVPMKYSVTGNIDLTSNVQPSTTYIHPSLVPVTQWAMVATLNHPTLEVIRQIIREEISAALEQRDNRGLDSLMADINEPVDEQEEIAAVLATMTPAEWETLVQRAKARKVTE